MFRDYLHGQRLSAATCATYEKYLSIFTGWLEAEGLHGSTFVYTDIVDFMQKLKLQGRSDASVRYHLSVLRHYGNYLIQTAQRNDNPATGLYVRGLIRRLPTNLLSMEDMEQLVQQYSIQLNVDDARKLMFSLLVYQGLTVGELTRLESRDIRLQEGKIYIRCTSHSNERLLNLHGSQVPRLQAYLKQNKFRSDPLLIAQDKGMNIHNRIRYMFKQLKMLNERVINAGQIRSSVITYWLSCHSIRQVQYMAGHKYVSSTERYQLTHLEDLQSEVNRHHPMK